MSEYYDHTTYPAAGVKGTSAAMRAELELIDTGLAKLPTLAGNGAKAVVVNALATALAVTVGTLALAGNFATTGAYNTTLVQQGSTSITLPTTNSVMARTDAAQTFTGVQTFSSQPILSSLTASQAVFTDGSKGLVSNAVTGTGNVVMSNDATLVAPALGTPASGVATNLTGTAAGLTAGNVTTNANLTGPITSTGNATAVAAQTGTGSTFVMQASPTLTTPNIGVATATSINKVAITAPATSATLTIADGKTLTASNTLTLTATDGSTLAIGTGGTLSGMAYQSGSWASPGAALGTGTPVAGTFLAISGTTLTLTTGASATAIIANATGGANYNVVSLNGSSTAGSNMGLLGGAAGDLNLYVDTTSTGNIQLRPGGTTSVTYASTGAITYAGTTFNMTASGSTLTVGVGADNGTVSAGVFTDRTKAFEGNALAAIKGIKAKGGHIDHASLPAFATANVRKQSTDAKGKVTETIEVERDLGAMISMLTVAVQELDARKMDKP